MMPKRDFHEAREELARRIDEFPEDVVVLFTEVINTLVEAYDREASECERLRRTRDDLHKANNRYLQRARTAEHWVTTWKKSMIRAVDDATEQRIKAQDLQTQLSRAEKRIEAAKAAVPFELEFENGHLTKIDGARPEYMDGYRLLEVIRILAVAAATLSGSNVGGRP